MLYLMLIHQDDAKMEAATPEEQTAILVDVENLDAAIRIAERAPATRHGAVEIRPMQA